MARRKRCRVTERGLMDELSEIDRLLKGLAGRVLREGVAPGPVVVAVLLLVKECDGVLRLVAMSEGEKVA